MKDKYFEVKFPNYGIEIILENDDILSFILYYSSKTRPYFLLLISFLTILVPFYFN